jgi:hypothetical protein
MKEKKKIRAHVLIQELAYKRNYAKRGDRENKDCSRERMHQRTITECLRLCLMLVFSELETSHIKEILQSCISPMRDNSVLTEVLKKHTNYSSENLEG